MELNEQIARSKLLALARKVDGSVGARRASALARLKVLARDADRLTLVTAIGAQLAKELAARGR
jgi:predicted flap endonuclease-1-like 5' DNA nuclease